MTPNSQSRKVALRKWIVVVAVFAAFLGCVLAMLAEADAAAAPAPDRLLRLPGCHTKDCELEADCYGATASITIVWGRVEGVLYVDGTEVTTGGGDAGQTTQTYAMTTSYDPSVAHAIRAEWTYYDNHGNRLPRYDCVRETTVQPCVTQTPTRTPTQTPTGTPTPTTTPTPTDIPTDTPTPTPTETPTPSPTPTTTPTPTIPPTVTPTNTPWPTWTPTPRPTWTPTPECITTTEVITVGIPVTVTKTITQNIGVCPDCLNVRSLTIGILELREQVAAQTLAVEQMADRLLELEVIVSDFGMQERVEDPLWRQSLRAIFIIAGIPAVAWLIVVAVRWGAAKLWHEVEADDTD